MEEKIYIICLCLFELKWLVEWEREKKDILRTALGEIHFHLLLLLFAEKHTKRKIVLWPF